MSRRPAERVSLSSEGVPMLRSDSMRRLIRTTGEAIVLSLLLSAAPANAEPQRIDAGPFLDASLPDCGLQKAIDSVPEGGILVIPKGTYLLRCCLILNGSDGGAAAALRAAHGFGRKRCHIGQRGRREPVQTRHGSSRA
jgi:hypothetical protein